MFLIPLPVDQTRGRDTMKAVNMLHYRFVKNKFGLMSQAPCCGDGAKCLSVRGIKASRRVGSDRRGETVSAKEKKPPEALSHPHSCR